MENILEEMTPTSPHGKIGLSWKIGRHSRRILWNPKIKPIAVLGFPHTHRIVSPRVEKDMDFHGKYIGDSPLELDPLELASSIPEIPKDSWVAARELALYGVPIPGIIVAFIRYLRSEPLRGDNYKGSTPQKFIAKLLASPSMNQTFTQSLRIFFPERTSKTAEVSPPALQRYFTGEDLSALLALAILYRRVLRGADPQLRTSLAQHIHLYAEIGGHVGLAIPAIGFFRGSLIGSMRFMGLALLMRMDPQDWGKYRRLVKARNLSYDLALEESFWGCNHIQVAAVLMQMVGLGSNVSVAFLDALGVHIDTNDLNPTALAIRQGDIWIEQLFRFGAPPHVVHNAEFYPLASSLDSLLSRVDQVRNKGVSAFWLDYVDESKSSKNSTSYREEPTSDDWYENPTENMEEEVLRELGKFQ